MSLVVFSVGSLFAFCRSMINASLTQMTMRGITSGPLPMIAGVFDS